MNSTRETVYQTLFENVSAAIGFKTASRRIAPITQVDPASMPAFYQQQVREIVTIQSRGIPTRYDLDVDLVLYVNSTDDMSVIPSTLLNNAVDAIEKMLPGTGPTYQTFGLAGVSEIRIQGEVVYSEGALASTAIAVVPVHIVAV